MPKFGPNMVEAVLVHWLKGKGDSVLAGEDIAEIETEKVNTVITAPKGGMIVEVLFGEGDQVPVGAIIARIDEGTTSKTNPEAGRGTI